MDTLSFLLKLSDKTVQLFSHLPLAQIVSQLFCLLCNRFLFPFFMQTTCNVFHSKSAFEVIRSMQKIPEVARSRIRLQTGQNIRQIFVVFFWLLIRINPYSMLQFFVKVTHSILHLFIQLHKPIIVWYRTSGWPWMRLIEHLQFFVQNITLLLVVRLDALLSDQRRYRYFAQRWKFACPSHMNVRYARKPNVVVLVS